MPNFVKIPRQMKEFPIQALDSNCSVCMAAICYSHPIKTISSGIIFLPLKLTHAKFREDITSNKKVSQTST